MRGSPPISPPFPEPPAWPWPCWTRAPLGARRFRSATSWRSWEPTWVPAPGSMSPRVSLEALKENLDASLDIYGDVILNPAFPRTDFERLKKQRLAQIQQEKADPVGLALRVFPGLLYGRRPCLRQPVDRLRNRGIHGQDQAGRPDPLSSDLVQAQPRHADRGRRHHHGGDQAQAGAAVRLLEAGRRAGQEHRHGGPAAAAGGLPDRSARAHCSP